MCQAMQELLAKILSAWGERSEQERELVARAFAYAAAAHSPQKRASGEPYLVHPAGTAATLAKMGLDAPTLAAALLHDVVDDTPKTNDDIKRDFGDEIALLVAGVTKLGKIKYRGAKGKTEAGIQRQAENLRKMFLAMAEDIRVVLIKLADRLHNMETLKALPERKQNRIALETLDIYAPLAGRLGIGELKAKLDDLAFHYVYPNEYNALIREVREAYAERDRYCEKIVPIVKKTLEDAGIKTLSIHARAKHYFSLWQKLQRLGGELAKVHDLVALRIVVPTIADCYETLGVLHKHWKPLPGRIKDYIAVPKPNGYQSIHTTVFCEDGRITEFQVRTPEMHAQAEYGIAAHWAYTEAGKSAVAVHNRFRWVEQLRDWQKEVSGTQEFLDTLKIDFFRDRIYVFTPKGEVLELPEGATPIDFAYHVHSEIGDQAVGARVNDKFVGLDVPLANGDVIEVLTQKGKKPSVKWLEIAKTTAARHHIRKSLREHGIEVAAPPPQPLRAEVALEAEDRVGLAKDITTTVSRAGYNIVSLEGKGKGEGGDFHMIVTIASRAELRKLLERLKKVKGVLEVTGRIV